MSQFNYPAAIQFRVGTYVVDVKRSARRTNGAVGAAVCRDGARWRFGSRADAERWATTLSKRGTSRVWIRTADPADDSLADAYLVGRYPQSALDGAYDKRRRRLRPPSREQTGLARYDTDVDRQNMSFDELPDQLTPSATR